MNAAPPAIDRKGLSAAIASYVLWGVFPLYWYLLKHVPAMQIISHRIVWCALFVVGFLVIREGWGWLRTALMRPRVAWMLLASSVFISFNWGIYIWAVTNGRVIEASLGYFINPLVNVLIGVLVLHERLNRAQWAAVAIAGLGVLWLALLHGDPPWIALALAFSFAFYGLIRKLANVDAVPGLAIESLFLLVPALAWLGFAHSQGVAAFGDGNLASDALLVFGGALTALPLIGFAYGARRIPYSLVGILQYIAPTLQLIGGVWLLGEAFTGTQAIGFGAIWVALAIYGVDGWRRSRRQPALAAREHCAEQVPACDGAAPPHESERRP
ncbi:MAG: EamA family transporter RarD [Arenimonas sp.]|uniref:EamA family transporter RarD n=1 Tax=Arenimonas sp. TaxID=1872635 RepID=UPI0025BF369E|nr:EamA family transporter RarD [Arenimonas sp.]MBW8369250.1 EamA family transporter RarD [Arenimonas sp.]